MFSNDLHFYFTDMTKYVLFEKWYFYFKVLLDLSTQNINFILQKPSFLNVNIIELPKNPTEKKYKIHLLKGMNDVSRFRNTSLKNLKHTPRCL